MAKVDTHAFDDMLTTHDFSGYRGEGDDKQVNKNHKNASEYNAAKNYGKNSKTTKVMKDACKSKKKKMK